MRGRIVEVAEDKRHLFVSHGFLVVEDAVERETLGKVPLDDIAALIGNAHGLTYSNNVLVALGERGAPVVLCGANHMPVALLWPVDGNSLQAKRFDAQLAATKPMSKRIWAEIVRAKITQQAAVLEAVGQTSIPLSSLVGKVRSGDSGNVEAQAARRYWSLLFGVEFRRDREAGGINALLNYGYTVLRAAVARGVIAAGLHPTIGLHHRNEGNAMRLVDDLMEPFRAIVDLQVLKLSRDNSLSLSPDTKRLLASVMYADMETESGTTPVITCIQRAATSLAQVYLGERDNVDLPLPGLPLTMGMAR